MYNLITIYDDGYTKTETANDIVSVFNTAAIYLQDRECVSILCLDLDTHEFIIDFTR